MEKSKREFNQFNYQTRNWLGFMLGQNKSRKEIAAMLSMNPSSITREINRNSTMADGVKVYDPIKAQVKSEQRQSSGYRRMSSGTHSDPGRAAGLVTHLNR